MELNQQRTPLCQWLIEHSPTDNAFILAHLDDGILWGRIEPDDAKTSDAMCRLVTASEATAGEQSHLMVSLPKLSWGPLWCVRVFSPTAELFVWRNGNRWESRLVEDVESAEGPPSATRFDESYDEQYFLWGTSARPLSEGFTLLSHEAQGLQHVVPVIRDVTGNRPLQLQVRHYLNHSGMARVIVTRLVDFVEGSLK